MFTPQQIDQISFRTSRMQAGYNIDDVDAFLEPLTEDYVTLYKENALLKSKMRVLVGKLEEYRKNEADMKDAVINAQKTCDKMVREAEEKCAADLGAKKEKPSSNARGPLSCEGRGDGGRRAKRPQPPPGRNPAAGGFCISCPNEAEGLILTAPPCYNRKDEEEPRDNCV